MNEIKIPYGEFSAKQGFNDILIEKSETSRATYEAVIEIIKRHVFF